MAMSFAAFLLVLLAATAGWGQNAKDEGAAAHIFQLLVVVQLPFILAFLTTADWSRFTRIAAVLSMQAIALVLAFAPVAYFNL